MKQLGATPGRSLSRLPPMPSDAGGRDTLRSAADATHLATRITSFRGPDSYAWLYLFTAVVRLYLCNCRKKKYKIRRYHSPIFKLKMLKCTKTHFHPPLCRWKSLRRSPDPRVSLGRGWPIPDPIPFTWWCLEDSNLACRKPLVAAVPCGPCVTLNTLSIVSLLGDNIH